MYGGIQQEKGEKNEARFLRKREKINRALPSSSGGWVGAGERVGEEWRTCAGGESFSCCCCYSYGCVFANVRRQRRHMACNWLTVCIRGYNSIACRFCTLDEVNKLRYTAGDHSTADLPKCLLSIISVFYNFKHFFCAASIAPSKILYKNNSLYDIPLQYMIKIMIYLITFNNDYHDNI